MKIIVDGAGGKHRAWWVPRTGRAGAVEVGTAGEATPCWHCHWFEALEVSGSAICGYGGRTHSNALCHIGCVSFEREPGADDEPGPPPVALRVEYPAFG